MSYINRKKKNKAKMVFIYIIIAIIIGLGAFVFLSPTFEKNSPKVSLENEIFWNLKSPLKVKFTDDNEIASYVITYSDNNNAEIKLDTKTLDNSKGSIDLNILAPKIDLTSKTQDVKLKLEVYDTSKWNFFMGNKTTKNITVKVDKKSPVANVLSNSYLLKRGGSAAVVVEVKDDNLKDKYISFNTNAERFELFPFYKKNFYVAIITWPIDIKTFERVNLIAIDHAKNKTVTKVPLYIKEFKTKIDNIKISDKFINKVSKNVLTKSGYDIPSSPEQIFVKENKELRKRNIDTIKSETRNMNTEKVSKFNIKAFKQLPSSMTFAGFGERRHYTYKGKKIDEAWHLGMDWASVKKAKIFTTNAGKVIFKDYLGIYGDTIIIDHKFGLGTLYAHTSRSVVEVNQNLKAGAYIANTGSSGAVFGDHLHFGVLVQGIEVNPTEWLSRYWVRENITKIINNAMKEIDTK